MEGPHFQEAPLQDNGMLEYLRRGFEQAVGSRLKVAIHGELKKEVDDMLLGICECVKRVGEPDRLVVVDAFLQEAVRLIDQAAAARETAKIASK